MELSPGDERCFCDYNYCPAAQYRVASLSRAWKLRHSEASAMRTGRTASRRVSAPGRRPRGPRPGPLRAPPLCGASVARLGCGDRASPWAPTSVLGAPRASRPPRSGQGQGSRRGSPPRDVAYLAKGLGRRPQRPGPRRRAAASAPARARGRAPRSGRASRRRAALRRAEPGAAEEPEGRGRGARGCGRRGPGGAGRGREGRGDGREGRGGGGAATRGRPLRRAGAPRNAAVTLIFPGPGLAPQPRVRDFSVRDAPKR